MLASAAIRKNVDAAIFTGATVPIATRRRAAN